MDWPTVTVAAHIAAEPHVVWELVSDIGLMPTFSDELQSVHWIDGDRPRPGARFAGTNAHPLIGTWTTTSQIVECSPPRAFGWAVGDPEQPAATWCFTLEDAAGATDVRFTARIGPGRSGVSMLTDRDPLRRDEIVANRLGQFERSMTATVAGIKALAESTTRSSAGDATPPARSPHP